MFQNEREKYDIHISVRGLVEFLLRNGDIDNRMSSGSEIGAMQEGSRIHKMIQGKMGPNYEPEVPLFFVCEKELYSLTIEGRADGIITDENGVTIDEIKATYRKLDRMKAPIKEHLAQAKCYAFMYGIRENLQNVRIRLTYCNIESEEIRYFFEEESWEELRQWFMSLLEEYDKWAEFKCRHYYERQDSIHELEFPFEYREGQRELATQVYQTIVSKRKLFLEAPTGVGKTITTVFPTIKAIGMNKADQMFYLTAKTITRSVALNTFSLLREHGLKCLCLVITAKEKICPFEKTQCNPDACDRAKGHLDRVNAALYALITENSELSREVIEQYAFKYKVCPYELSLDASLFADAIICDYNYLFDPEARLKRFFETGAQGNYLFLIDEAHNLLDRGREMYSAVLKKDTFLELKRSVKAEINAEMRNSSKQVEGQLSLFETDGIPKAIAEAENSSDDKDENGTTALSDVFEAVPDENADTAYFSMGKKKRKGARSVFVREGYADRLIYHLDKCNRVLLEMKRECEGSRIIDSIDEFVAPLNRLYSCVSEYLELHETYPVQVLDEVLDLFFDIAHFLEIYEVMDENYIKYTQTGDDGSFIVKLFCTNPAENLKACMKMGVSTTLFSATFLPIQYYKSLLGGEKQDYEVYARSVFPPENAGIFIGGDVTSRYSSRSEEQFKKIADYISRVVASKRGNYLVFCPSYSFMNHVYDAYMDSYALPDEECLLQQESMSETDRENFLKCFTENEFYGKNLPLKSFVTNEFTENNLSDTDTSGKGSCYHSVTGFCVMGGIFGEGIDLKADSLIGTIIVGTGLPGVGFERELIKHHFDDENNSGFDYAYKYPGMTRVLQAAGRVIRTENDRGVIVLLDDRFNQKQYYSLFPREWNGAVKVTLNSIKSELEKFWNTEEQN